MRIDDEVTAGTVLRERVPECADATPFDRHGVELVPGDPPHLQTPVVARVAEARTQVRRATRGRGPEEAVVLVGHGAAEGHNRTEGDDDERPPPESRETPALARWQAETTQAHV